MKLSDFDFILPTELIAQTPEKKRDESNLLIASNDLMRTKFYSIIDYLLPGDLLVFNDSKVIKAKLLLNKAGKEVILYLNKPISTNYWHGFAKPSKKLNEGDQFDFDGHKIIIGKKLTMGQVEVAFNLHNRPIRKLAYAQGFIGDTEPRSAAYSNVREDSSLGATHKLLAEVEFPKRSNISVLEFLEQYGKIPLPPYIKRLEELSEDSNRYQTVYGKNLGAVAAPTAGLHFSDELLTLIKSKNIETAFVTLHVGAGTFLPVKTDDIDQHKMHSEYYHIDQRTADIINRAKQENRRIIAVGTTTLRTLESNAAINGTIIEGEFETDIFIKPGFKFQMVDMLVTNFHLPKSTLLILVCAFAGYKEIMDIYQYAINNQMRFFSYGDAALLYHKPHFP